METFCFTQLQPSSDVPHPNVHFLHGNDTLLDSWDGSGVMQHTKWNDPKTWLLQITIECDRLNHDVIAVLFTAEGISNNICFSGMILNFQFVIFNQLQPSSLPHIQIWLGE
jgi:hypothetical protein